MLQTGAHSRKTRARKIHGERKNEHHRKFSQTLGDLGRIARGRNIFEEI